MYANVKRCLALPAALVAAMLLLPGAAAAQGIQVNMMPVSGLAADGQPRAVNFVVVLPTGMLATDAAVTWAFTDKGTFADCTSFSPGMVTCTFTPPSGGPAGQAELMMDVTAGGQKASNHFSLSFGAGPAAVAPAVAPPVVAPVVTAPVAAAPVVTQPVQPVQPVVTQPVQPVQPVVTQPVVTQPVVTQPVVTQPVVTQPVVTQPVVTQPVVTQPVVTQPPAWQPPTQPVQPVQPAVTAVQPVQPLTTPQYAGTATTTVPAPTGTAKFPYTDQPYRLAKVYLRYPVVGYKYSQVADPCTGDRACTFPDLEIAGPEGTGPVAAPASFGVGGEVFPIEFLGAAVAFERFGYSTEHKVVREDGSEGSFGDGVHRIQAGARVRLPLLATRVQGPLDVIIDLGYQGQDFLYFETAHSSSQWTYNNIWGHGFRFGGGLRFQAIPALVIHGDYHGTVTGGGLIGHESEIGAQIRLYKNIVADISWLLVSRSIRAEAEVTDESLSAEPIVDAAEISDLGIGVGISVGVTF